MPLEKLKTPAELSVIRDSFAAGNRTLVFTNGCFDLLHVGHVRYLQAARALGDALVVALNGDDSVRVLKGAGRPLNGQAERSEVIAALACVDFVTTFPSARVTDLLRRIRPHIYVKGGDYSIETLHPEEVDALREIGAEIRIVPLVPDRSTSATLAKMRSTATDR